MYQLVTYYRETKTEYKSGLNEVVEREYFSSDEFRLRKNALHYLLEIVRSDYREQGYATEERVGGIFCYKSEKTTLGTKTEEIHIKVEKV